MVLKNTDTLKQANKKISGNSSLEDFLKEHTLAKDSPKELITHTEFGKYSNRKFSILEQDDAEFQQLYYRDVIKPKKEHNIIERQLIDRDQSAGSILVDLDFRFSAEQTIRYYTKEHIQEFIDVYLGVIKNTFEMDEDVHFQIYVSEKPSPRLEIKDTGSVVKDGIHIQIGLAWNRVYHQYLRQKVLDILSQKWSHFPIINSGGWEDVFDDAISSGTNGWLKYRSKKRDDQTHYQLTYVFDVYYDVETEKWNMESVLGDNEDTFLAKNYKKLSVRYKDHPTLLCKETILPEIKQWEQQKKSFKNTNSPINRNNTNSPLLYDDSDEQSGSRISIHTLREIQTKEELDLCLFSYLDNISPSQYHLKETYEYTMTLPETYYGEGSYNKWIKVGFALRNIHYSLLVVWLSFSAQSKTFQYATHIRDLCDRWSKMKPNPEGGVTKQSIMYWSKHDAFECFERVREKTVDFYLDQTIENITMEDLNNPKKKNAKGCSDFDIATVLHQLFKDDYVATSIKTNEWYQFNKNRWFKNDSGTSLRKSISTTLRDIYRKKANDLFLRASTMDPESDEYKMTVHRTDKILGIAMLLGSTKDKDNIMKEARELFYNPDFMEKLDENKYLLCFNNGVIDFKEKIFRKGYPEDYISKCTNIDYIPLNPSIHKKTMDEINDYMRKVFPIEELYKYMWDHLASVLIGDIALNQRLHYYTGIGSNGKSMLVKLMQMCLGNYAVELDVSFYTQDRPKRGQSTPELFAIMGARYAITAEPSEGDKLNEGPMKQLTSGTDKMSCRAPYGQLVSFTPQANPVIMANHFLDIKSTDHGTWRRIAVIEFMSLFTDEPVTGDKSKPYQFKKVESFDAKFEEWVPIFMSMLVHLAFKTGGIVKLCPMVMASSNRYKQNQDFISEFIGEKITKDANGKIKKTELLFEFSEWYKSNYGTRINNKTKELCAAMNKLFGECKSAAWIGAKIIYDRDTDNGYDGASSILSNGGNTTFTDTEECDDDGTEIIL